MKFVTCINNPKAYKNIFWQNHWFSHTLAWFSLNREPMKGKHIVWTPSGLEQKLFLYGCGKCYNPSITKVFSYVILVLTIFRNLSHTWIWVSFWCNPYYGLSTSFYKFVGTNKFEDLAEFHILHEYFIQCNSKYRNFLEGTTKDLVGIIYRNTDIDTRRYCIRIRMRQGIYGQI